MKFTKTDGKIKCIRITADNNGNIEERVVAEFDEAIGTVAPHVAASLHAGEISQLTTWLQEHITLNKKLSDQPLKKTVLETLPALLDEAIVALQEIDALDADLHREIKEKLTIFGNKLGAFDPLIFEKALELNEIQDNEILKNQLGKIKNEL